MAVQETKNNNAVALSTLSTGKDLGVVRNGGNIAGSRFAKTDLGDTKSLLGGSKVVDHSQVDKIISAGDLAHIAAEQYQIRGYSSKIAGQPDTTLQIPGSDRGFRKSVQFIDAINMSFLDQLTWDTSTDLPTYTFVHLTNKVTFWNISTGAAAAAADNAANPSLTKPGELTFMQGGKNPTNTQYEAKNLF